MEVLSPMTRQTLNTQALWLNAEENLLINSRIVSAVHLSVSPFDHELYLATTAQNSYVSYDNPAFSYDPDEAQFKALMKAVACRACLSRPDRSIIERADRLNREYLSPLVYTPLEEKRLSERCLKPFRTNRRIHWTLGTSFDGHPVYVPEDLVYRGRAKDFIYYANDSGVAAHPDQLTAIEDAVMSRIRADACMRTWYKRLEPYVIDSALLGERIKSRVEYWRTSGRELIITQLDNSYGEVYLAILRGPNYPCFVSGVGATISGETEGAILEAIAATEANFGLLSGISCVIPSLAANVPISALDQAIYYCDSKHSQDLEFLTARKKLSPPFKRPPIDFLKLVKELELIVCWLTEPRATYHVARVFSRHLVPISYGVGLEHSTHAALEQGSAPVDETNRYLPHCFYRP